MKQILTAKLRLHPTSEQFQALRQTQLAYRDALNAVSRYAFAHGKISNQRALQKAMYTEIRALYGLPSQLACNVSRQVGATYQALWTKVKQNAVHRQAGYTKKRYQGLDQPPKYVSPTLTSNYGYDYSFKANQQVSVLTLQGRVIVPYTGYDKHVALIHHGAQIGAARLWYEKAHKRLYLLVCLEIDVADPSLDRQTGVVGVDVGMRYLAVTSDPQGKSTFSPGKKVVSHANHYARLRRRLQHKGTRSATRRLVAISGRERRLKADANHVVSTRIVMRHPKSLIGLEHLTGIRERTRRRAGARASHAQRNANAAFAKWSFAELQQLIAYKARWQGSLAIRGDAHSSSQACPRCGHTARENRPQQGLLFVCQRCQYTLHAEPETSPCARCLSGRTG